MDNRTDKKEDRNLTDNKTVKSDAQSESASDPQDNMKGPVSSFMHGTGDSFETDETKEEADEEKDQNM
jgi:hypothetical protein